MEEITPIVGVLITSSVGVLLGVIVGFLLSHWEQNWRENKEKRELASFLKAEIELIIFKMIW